jgi:hypothetical protein
LPCGWLNSSAAAILSFFQSASFQWLYDSKEAFMNAKCWRHNLMPHSVHACTSVPLIIEYYDDGLGVAVRRWWYCNGWCSGPSVWVFTSGWYSEGDWVVALSLGFIFVCENVY